MLGAVEGGGTKFLCAVGQGHDALVESARFATRGPEETLDDVIAFLGRYALEGVGIGCFGPLELASGVHQGELLRTPKPGWGGVNIAARIGAALRLPVRIDTDVNAAALGEARWGSGRGADPLLYVTLGTGVGGGVLIGGRPLHGLLHPELGHLPMPVLAHPTGALDDFAGVCPFHGRCLEGVASGPAIRARVGEPAESLPDDHPVWELTGRYLGRALASAVLLLAPQRIVVGGGVGGRVPLLDAARRALVDALGGYLPRRELTDHVGRYVVAPGLGGASGLAGAFLLAAEARSELHR